MKATKRNMSLIKGRLLALWLCLLTAACFSTYGALIVVDLVLAKIISANMHSEPGARQIVAKRINEEDIPSKKAAIEDGYQPILYPYFISADPEIRALADKYNVAPLAPQPNTKIYFCNEGYGLLKYTTDRFGFRNNDNVWDKDVKMLLIGDSFAQGACVPFESSIGGHLQGRGLVNLSLGTGANSPYHYASLAKVFTPCIKPKYMAVIFYANDNVLNEDKFHYEHYFKEDHNYLTDGCEFLAEELQSFYKEVKPLVLSKASGNDSLAHPNKSNLLARAKRYISLPTIRMLFYQFMVGDNELSSGSRLAIETAVSVCRSYSCTPIILYIPNSSFWSPNSRSEAYVKQLREYTSDTALFIDSSEALSELGLHAYADKGSHLSPAGYGVVANQIAEIIEKQRIYLPQNAQN